MRKIKNFCVVIGIIFAFFMLFFLTVVGAVNIKVGASRGEVITALGEPQGNTKSGDEEILCYPGGMIVINNGKVTYIDENFNVKKPTALPQVKEEKKIVKDVTEPHIKVYKEGGKSINLNKVLVTGKVTIVDFYAEWCGSCQVIGPQLEQLARSDPEVFLRKIDIVNWQSPVVKQYSISSVPHIRIFNRKGQMIGKPTYNLDEVKVYVKKAK